MILFAELSPRSSSAPRPAGRVTTGGRSARPTTTTTRRSTSPRATTAARSFCRSHRCSYERSSPRSGLTPTRRNGTWTPHGDAVARYRYVDEQGPLLFEVCRTADKQFPQRRPDPTAKSGWRWNLDGVRRVLYRLPQVLAAVERGEIRSTSSRARRTSTGSSASGVTATCNPVGAGKWRPEYATALAGATVVVIADRDEPGLAHARQVESSLKTVGGHGDRDAGRRGQVRRRRLRPPRGRVRARGVGHGAGAQPVPRAGRGGPRAREALDAPSEPRLLRTIRGDAIEMRSIEWLDKPLLQGSAFHLGAGPKGVGKGTWLARKIADITQGRLGPKRNVLIVSSEDSASIDLKPRLVAAGADHTRWHLVVEELVLPRDLYRIEDLAATVGDVGLIVLDPVGNHLGGVDTDKEGLVRFAIGGLNKLADELACMIIGVRHLGKSRINGALAAVLGSTAWVDVPRAVLAFARDDEDEMVFHVQVVAGNRSGRTAAHGLPDRAPRRRPQRARHLRRPDRRVAQERRRPPRRAAPRIEVGRRTRVDPRHSRDRRRAGVRRARCACRGRDRAHREDGPQPPRGAQERRPDQGVPGERRGLRRRRPLEGRPHGGAEAWHRGGARMSRPVPDVPESGTSARPRGGTHGVGPFSSRANFATTSRAQVPDFPSPPASQARGWTPPRRTPRRAWPRRVRVAVVSGTVSPRGHKTGRPPGGPTACQQAAAHTRVEP